MAVPTVITELSITAGSNSPLGSESIGTNADDYIRAHAAFIAQLKDGSKNLELGTVTAPTLAFTGDSNTGVYSPGADRLGLVTAGAMQWEVSAAGRLLNPANTQVAFAANRTTDQTSGTTLVFSSEIFDQGAGFNTTTGIFTASVAGLYYFTATLPYFNNTGALTGAGCALYVNAGLVAVSAVSLPTGYSHTLTLSRHLRLAANDTVRVDNTNTALSATFYLSGSTSGAMLFSGHLVG